MISSTFSVSSFAQRRVSAIREKNFSFPFNFYSSSKRGNKIKLEKGGSPSKDEEFHFFCFFGLRSDPSQRIQWKGKKIPLFSFLASRPTLFFMSQQRRPRPRPRRRRRGRNTTTDRERRPRRSVCFSSASSPSPMER